MVDTGIYTEDCHWGPDLHFVSHYFQAMQWRGPARIVEPHKHDGLMWMHDKELAGLAATPNPRFPLFAPTKHFITLGGLDRLRD